MSFEFQPRHFYAMPSETADRNDLLIAGYRKPGKGDAPCHRMGPRSEQISLGVRVAPGNLCPNFIVKRVLSREWGKKPSLELEGTGMKILPECAECPVVRASGVQVKLTGKSAA